MNYRNKNSQEQATAEGKCGLEVECYVSLRLEHSRFQWIKSDSGCHAMWALLIK